MHCAALLLACLPCAAQAPLVQPTALTATVNARSTLDIYELDRNADMTLTLPFTGRSVWLYQNGRRLWPDEYTLAGDIVRLHDPCWPADEIVTATIRR